MAKSKPNPSDHLQSQSQPQPYRPMAAAEPTLQEQIDVLRLRIEELERIRDPFILLYKQHHRVDPLKK